MGVEFNKIMDMGFADNSEMIREMSQKFAYHGNWCGPGHSGPEPPIDQLDAACMWHDNCYASWGYDCCSCDSNMIAKINKLLPTLPRHLVPPAKAVKLAMQVKSCTNMCKFGTTSIISED